MAHKIDNSKIYLASGTIIFPKHKIGLDYREEDGINQVQILTLCHWEYYLYEYHLNSIQDEQDNEHNREVRWLSLKEQEKKEFEDLVAKVKKIKEVILNRTTIEKYLGAREIGKRFAPLYKKYWDMAEKVGFTANSAPNFY